MGLLDNFLLLGQKAAKEQTKTPSEKPPQGGRIPLEWVAGLNWNHRPDNFGISGRIPLERAEFTPLSFERLDAQ
jgi:hypothetical protein